LSKRILKVTPTENEIIKEELKYNSHIPINFQEKLENLKNVKYKDILMEFSSEYYKNSYKNIKEEYEIVAKYMVKITNHITALNINSFVDKSFRSALAIPYIDDGMREQFIHPFQVFLLGTIIIDSYYPEFNSWYYRDIESDTSMEDCWVFTSFFHDKMKTILKMLELIEGEIKIGKTEYPRIDIHSDLLASIYTHLESGNSCLNWEYDNGINEDVKSIIIEYGNKKNHAVLSALNILYQIEKESKDILFNPECNKILNACLAITMHNKGPREDFLERGIFPLNIENFPIQFLLIYCDTMHEWSRDRGFEYEEKEEIDLKLSEIRISKNEVYCEISFDNKEKAKEKLDECHDVKACLSNSPIKFDFGIRTHLA
jgi:hypothetical protein